MTQLKENAYTITISNSKGEKVGETVVTKKEFSSGSVGYHASEKVILDKSIPENRFQCNFILTLIGSKPKK